MTFFVALPETDPLLALLRGGSLCPVRLYGGPTPDGASSVSQRLRSWPVVLLRVSAGHSQLHPTPASRSCYHLEQTQLVEEVPLEVAFGPRLADLNEFNDALCYLDREQYHWLARSRELTPLLHLATALVDEDCDSVSHFAEELFFLPRTDQGQEKKAPFEILVSQKHYWPQRFDTYRLRAVPAALIVYHRLSPKWQRLTERSLEAVLTRAL